MGMGDAMGVKMGVVVGVVMGVVVHGTPPLFFAIIPQIIPLRNPDGGIFCGNSFDESSVVCYNVILEY
jgi:hypothetical protein